jgi:hypothetical protein
MKRVFQAALLVALSMSVNSPASEIAAEELLDSLKQTLAEEAFRNGVELRGLAYMDESGSLREAQLFKAQTRVAATQVKAYLDAAGVHERPLSESVQLEQHCALADFIKMNPSAVITVRRGRAAAAANDGNLQTLANFVRTRAESQLNSTGWRAVPEEIKADAGHTRYAELAYGSGSSTANATYELYWDIAPAKGTPSTVKAAGRALAKPSQWVIASVKDRWPFDTRSLRHDSERLDITATLIHRASGREVYTGGFSYRLPSMPSQFSEAKSVAEFTGSIAPEIDALIEATHDAAECTPSLFAGSVGRDRHLTLSSGALDGIQLGQWFLAGDASLLADNWLTNDNLNSLAVYKVSELDRHSATLIPLTQSAKLNDQALFMAL